MSIWRQAPLVWLTLLLLSVASCATYRERRVCRETNWYQKGYEVALKGQSLNDDAEISACRATGTLISEPELKLGFTAGVERYCSGESIFEAGKKGQPIALAACKAMDSGVETHYHAGLKVFCNPITAYDFGSRGGKYENVCTKEDEATWLPEYRRGRKLFLSTVVSEKEKRRTHLLAEIRRLEERRNQLARQRSGLLADSSHRPNSDGHALRLESVTAEMANVENELQRALESREVIGTQLTQAQAEMSTF